ncbi:MAG: signal recognition particle receptor subunit alpha, partial [Candidatus Delongbacteria bacterium]|nr:signal recognition particle receptor subunit alpha [Candidatus Delongbacteria bacterium]
MALFRKKRVKEYLSEESFLKEYRDLLESRKGKQAERVSQHDKVEVIKKESYFEKLSRTLSKTKNTIVGKLNSIISKSNILNDDVLDDIEEALYTSDIGVKTTELIIGMLRERIHGERANESLDIKKLIKEEIIKLINKASITELDHKEKPHVI